MLPSIDRRELASIFLGGAVGTVIRTALSQAFPHGSGSWPWPTFGENVVGAFLLGYFATRLQERLPLSTYRRSLLGTGLCGTLTTFSTMQLEVLKMIDGRHYGLALGYTSASVVAGVLAVGAATVITRRVRLIA
jgi:CrcB protein